MKLAKLKIRNFRGLKGENIKIEDAHKEQYMSIGNNPTGSKDKPLRAYLFATSINDDNKNSFDCFKWLKDIVEKQEVLHDMNYINTKKIQK
ncbi:hypothetical protein AGMMS4957_15590 [Bacteroidia bacterium]|nr:hypothetical protein AGMMS4957_15590 [Bacteroidia bacterium]